MSEKKTRLLESNYFHTGDGGASIEITEIHNLPDKTFPEGHNSYELELRTSSYGYSSKYTTPIISPAHAIQFAEMLKRTADMMIVAANKGLISGYRLEKWTDPKEHQGNVRAGIRMERLYGDFVINSYDTASFELGRRLVHTGTGVAQVDMYAVPVHRNGGRGECGGTSDRGPIRHVSENYGRQVFYDSDTELYYYHPTNRIHHTLWKGIVSDTDDQSLDLGDDDADDAENPPNWKWGKKTNIRQGQTVEIDWQERMRVREASEDIANRFDKGKYRWTE